MEQVLETYRRGLGLLGRIEQVLIVVLLANIVLNITGQVISRYLFDKPLIWVEELATYSFIWSVFLGAALALKYDQHLRIATYTGRLGRRGQALARAFVQVIILTLFVLILGPLWAGIGIEMRRETIALPVQLPIGWFFSVPLFVGVVSMILTTLYRLIGEFAVMAGIAGPPSPIMPPMRLLDDEEETKAERALAGED